MEADRRGERLNISRSRNQKEYRGDANLAKLIKKTKDPVNVQRTNRPATKERLISHCLHARRKKGILQLNRSNTINHQMGKKKIPRTKTRKDLRALSTDVGVTKIFYQKTQGEKGRIP